MTQDLQLLHDYARGKSQAAFAELVRRHVNLVYSAALRQVRSPQLAEEVSQSVFLDLSRTGGQLNPDTILTAWLYKVTRRTAIDVIRRESRRQARERLAVEMAAMNTTADWPHIEPLLDEAMESLEETDRTAILLRYFENKSLREVGQSLGTSDDAAQKRVSRAVERLREFFSSRGVATAATGLVVAISANAVQSAPTALAAAISGAAALAGTAVQGSTLITATKAIVMTTMQKTIATAVVATLAGTAIYRAGRAGHLGAQMAALRQEQSPANEQIRQLQQQNDALSKRLAALAEENNRLKQNDAELLKLRGEVGALREQSNELTRLEKENRLKLEHENRPMQPPPPPNPMTTEEEEKGIWLIRGKQFRAEAWMQAFLNYARQHQGQLPESFEQAVPFWPETSGTQPEVAPDQFEILYHGSLNTITNSETIVFREKKLWQNFNGRWGRFDVLASGRAQYGSVPTGFSDSDFSDYEKEHIASSADQ